MANQIKLAAWSGIAMIVLYFVGSTINSLLGLGFWSYILIVLSSAATMIFTYGFFVLGKKYKQGLLKGFAIYFVVLAVITMILSIIAIPYLQGLMPYFKQVEQAGNDVKALSEKYGGEEKIPEAELNQLTAPFEDTTVMILKWFLIFYVLFIVFYGIPKIFFGIGLLKLGKKVEFSKAAGILNIVGGATTIVFVGIFLILIAFILEIIILLKESEKIKRR